jgi:RNA polymerase sigma-70 factor, ECF subfamily
MTTVRLGEHSRWPPRHDVDVHSQTESAYARTGRASGGHHGPASAPSGDVEPSCEGMISPMVDAELSPGFELLFRREFASVARTVFLIVHDRGSAEEITQEAFASLFRRWATISGYDRPDAWVRRVAIRMAVRYARREVRRPTIERSGNTLDTDRLPDPDLASAIASLAPRQRAAIVLYYWDDRPVSEIAQLLGTSESTVKQHLHRARHQLANRLGEGANDAIG